jgi:hypothetical protein
VEGEMDAMSNLSDDGKLSNVISAINDFTLNHFGLTISEPAVLITATDGCFGYFSTPMEFEYMLLDTLSASDNMEDWKDSLDSYIRKFTGDDYTMCVAVYGYKTFNALQKTYSKRKAELYEDYISKLENANMVVKTELWDKYKVTYCRNGGRR